MAKIPVFCSFRYDKDVMRVRQICHIGMIEGDEPLLLSPGGWKTGKHRGRAALAHWIGAVIAAVQWRLLKH